MLMLNNQRHNFFMKIKVCNNIKKYMRCNVLFLSVFAVKLGIRS